MLKSGTQLPLNMALNTLWQKASGELAWICQTRPAFLNFLSAGAAKYLLISSKAGFP